MFVCDNCLPVSLVGVFVIAPKSKGPCEDCGTIAVCSDVPTRTLIQAKEPETTNTEN